METLNNKTAFITGGSKGIGLAIAAALLEEGLNVAITSRSQAAADEAAASLQGTGTGKIIGIASDVRDFASQQQAIAQCIAAFGSIDVLIANAGVGKFYSIEEMSIEDWNAIIETNLTGAFYTLKAGIDALKQSKGYYMTVASLAGTNFFAKGTAYNASKFGVVGFTQAAMLDMRQYGIKTTTIMPGSVSTEFNGNEPSEKDAWKIQPEDLGQIVVDLLKMHPRTLPSKVEVRPTMPAKR